MNSTLTAARVALYWGAKVQYGNEISRMACISETQILTDIDWRSICDCKLLLRTVEQLTDEEKMELCHKLGYNPNHCFFSVNGNVFSFEYIGHSVSYIELKYLPYNAADYLRSIGVDIDNAIADGWAVKHINN